MATENYDYIQLNKRQITTAIYEYLEKRNKIPSKRWGIEIDNKYGNLQVWVEVKSAN